jgi:hypothetical protein
MNAVSNDGHRTVDAMTRAYHEVCSGEIGGGSVAEIRSITQLIGDSWQSACVAA